MLAQLPTRVAGRSVYNNTQGKNLWLFALLANVMGSISECVIFALMSLSFDVGIDPVS